MTTLSVIAITNFILASESFFFCGLLVAIDKSRFSAAWFWQYTFVLSSLSILISGIDHGFIEPVSPDLHRHFSYLSHCLLGAMSFFILLTIAQQFFSAWAVYFYVIGGVQYLLYGILLWYSDIYWIVVANYALPVLLFLVFSLCNIRRETGSWEMVLGLTIGIVASVIQLLKVTVSELIDENSLYHILTMFAVPLLYKGGSCLKKGVCNTESDNGRR